MKTYDEETVKERAHVEIHTNVQYYGPGELVGVVRGILEERRVDHKFRIRDGELEELYAYYYQGELLDQGLWRSSAVARLKEDGDTVIGIDPSGPPDHQEREGKPVQEWLREGPPTQQMFLDISEVWDEMWQDARNNE